MQNAPWILLAHIHVRVTEDTSADIVIKMSMNVLGRMGLVNMGRVSILMAHTYVTASLAIQVGSAYKKAKRSIIPIKIYFNAIEYKDLYSAYILWR